MSFLRHREIYQVRELSFADELLLKRARPRGHALAHRLDESPVGYSWRVALQQSPRPLHQPLPTLRQCLGELQEGIRCNGDPHLNSLSHFRGAPQTPIIASTTGVVCRCEEGASSLLRRSFTSQRRDRIHSCGTSCRNHRGGDGHHAEDQRRGDKRRSVRRANAIE